MLLTDQYSYMLEWLSPASGPISLRAEFVISHRKIDEINCKKIDDYIEKGYFLSFKYYFQVKNTFLLMAFVPDTYKTILTF